MKFYKSFEFFKKISEKALNFRTPKLYYPLIRTEYNSEKSVLKENFMK